MGDRLDKKSEPDSYPFIKETIKEKRMDKKAVLKKAALLALGGLLFGGFAAIGFAETVPRAMEMVDEDYSRKTEINLTESEASSSTPENQTQEAGSAGSDSESEKNKQESEIVASPLENYEDIYDEVLHVSEEPRKALVRVCGIGSDEDLLDNTFISYGDEQGIIFLKNETHYYILTGCKNLGETEQLQVTFCDGASVIAELCTADTQMNLAVVRVPKQRMTSRTEEAVSVAKLGSSYDSLHAKPVIAIGSPSGDPDAVIYGMVTSVSGKIHVADWEFNLLATDMKGSPDGRGVLLDTSGRVIGLIVHVEGETTNIVRAVSIAQMSPLIEALCNQESIRYLGICGVSFSENQRANMDFPEGIYVDSVETDSPAMIAGVKSGDIISMLDGTEITNMQEYTAKLQSITPGETVEVKLNRSSADGAYVEMNIQMTIKER